jgi:ubiquitin carboxyl-terminal hydrolase 7
LLQINDRYEFPDELDLDVENHKYLAPGADHSVRNVYKLHSVLVHQGTLNQGHYYAYIRPDGKNWLKFDDDRVERVDERQALEEQYGGDQEGAPAGPIGPNQQGLGTAGLAPGVIGTGFKFRKDSNAYMLVYVRKQQWEQYMGTVTKEDIAPYLRGRLEAEQAEKERRQAEKREAHLYCHVKVARDSDIVAAVGHSKWFDLVDYDKLGPESSFRVRV